MAKLPDNAQECEYCHHDPHGNAASHHLAAGTVLNNRYLIGDAIGEGGFGITYIGLDLNLNMKIAVKEFYPYGYANRNHRLTNDVSLIVSNETEDYFTDAKNRFLREAQGIAKFSKEHAIVDVRDYFTENNTAYIVMEYVEGVTLAAYLKDNGVFQADELIGRMIPLMEALEKMHRAEVIHRDISPENIIMTEDGSFKLMDFGSARYFAGDNKRTMSVILKPGYAPFEQYSADGNQGPWTDVYALCATMYKCITGVTPPDAMTRCQEDTLKAPSELGVSLTKGQEQALMIGMSIYPRERLHSVDDLIKMLVSSPEPVMKKRTLIAKKRRKTNDTGLTYGDTYSRFVSPEDLKEEKKQSAAVPILIAIAVFVVIIGGIVLYVVLSSANGKQTDDADESQAVTQEVTQAATQQPTQTEASDVVIMPDVTGKKYSKAKAELKDLGLSVEISREPSSTVAKGYVIRQSASPRSELKVGDSVMLYVSSGIDKNATEPPATTGATETAQSQTQAPTELEINVGAEVYKIRLQYLAAKASPGEKTEEDGVTYYTKNGEHSVITCDAGYNNWKYNREYYYKDGNLYFAYLYNDEEEHRLYFAEGALIRYIDSNGQTMDYGDIYCPIQARVLIESAALVNGH